MVFVDLVWKRTMDSFYSRAQKRRERTHQTAIRHSLMASSYLRTYVNRLSLRTIINQSPLPHTCLTMIHTPTNETGRTTIDNQRFHTNDSRFTTAEQRPTTHEHRSTTLERRQMTENAERSPGVVDRRLKCMRNSWLDLLIKWLLCIIAFVAKFDRSDRSNTVTFSVGVA